MYKDSVKPLEELLDSVRDIEGFPIAKDEDIIELSKPRYYTACPNPYIKQFIEKYGKHYNPNNDDYHREPFIGDVSEGKYDSFYQIHPFPTKVPHKAIMRYILHYSQPGDLILDGFCGTGMTGVAAQQCETPDLSFKYKIEKEMPLVKWGARKAILNDICPSATFISYNCNKPIEKDLFENKVKQVFKDLDSECRWMYQTNHITQIGENIKGQINYVVWSDVFVCPYCNNDYIFFDAAVDIKGGKVKKEFVCPTCNATITKSDCERANTTFFDTILKQKMTQTKHVPILINYSVGNKRYEKYPDGDDIALIKKIENMEIPFWFPTIRMPEGDESRRNDKYGITHVHHFYTKRNLWVLSKFLDSIDKKNLRFKFALTAVAQQITKLYRYTYQSGTWGAGGGPLSGTLYIPSLYKELNILRSLKQAIKKQLKALNNRTLDSNNVLITTQSSTQLNYIPENSIDYIFVDPPFGDNLMYSELNFIWEAWLKVFTNNKTEAIINKSQQKALGDYKKLIEKCFNEFYRTLKPNRWITVEFHNSKASVWNAIQEAITRAGFIIAQVSVLDKQKGSFKQVTAPGTVKNDLIINAYKPKEEFTERFLKNAGENMEVDFISQQLEHLPIRPNIERTEKMLYSKMLAHYVENGFKIRYNSTNFYRTLSDNFTDLDGYWFLDNQIKKYTDWKSGLSLDQIKVVFDGQQVLFVSDEKSALTWIFNFLNKPKTYSEIFTAYQQIATTSEDEIPELRIILDNNFILEESKYRRPLSDKEKDEKNKNRERELDRAFSKLLQQAKTQKGKIKSIRREALVHGFTKCYQQSKFDDILTIADKLHNSVLESSGEIMDFVDIARIKTSGKKKIEDF